MEGGDNAIDNKQFNWTKFSKGYKQPDNRGAGGLDVSARCVHKSAAWTTIKLSKFPINPQ